MKIIIASNESKEAVARVRALLDATALYDIDFNGVTFEIERGDFTCIDDDGSYDAATVLNAVNDELQGTREVPAGKGMTVKNNFYDL